MLFLHYAISIFVAIMCGAGRYYDYMHLTGGGLDKDCT